MAAEKKIIALIQQLGNEKKAASAKKKLINKYDSLTKSLLIAALDESYLSVKTGAAEILGMLKEAEAAAPLIKMLCCDEAASRQAAAGALGGLGETALAGLIKGDNDDFIRMAKSCDIRLIRHLLHSESFNKTASVRECIAESLGLIRDAEAVQLLIALLNDRHSAVKEKTVVSLGQLGAPEAAAPLIQFLETTGDSHYKQSIISTLGMLKNQIAVTPLILQLGCYAPEVRMAAANALHSLGEPGWADCVKGDEDDFLRLGSSGDARAAKPLRYALQDNRPAAAYALGVLKNPEALEDLLLCLCRPQAELRIAAAQALCSLGEPQWNAAVKGDREDFLRLAKLKDIRLNEPLMAFLIKNLGDAERFPLEYVSADRQETRNGNELETILTLTFPAPSLDDCDAYVTALVCMGGNRMVELLTQIVHDPQSKYHYQKRKDAALTLIKLAEADGTFAPDNETIEKIAAPHIEIIRTLYDSSDSTGYTSSQDMGIGFDIGKTALAKTVKPVSNN